MKTRSKGLRIVEQKMLFRQILADAGIGQGHLNLMVTVFRIGGSEDTRLSVTEAQADLNAGWCWQRYSNDGERTTVAAVKPSGGFKYYEGSWGSNGIGLERSPVDFDSTRRPFMPGMVLIEMVEGSNNRGCFQRITITKAPVLDD